MGSYDLTTTGSGTFGPSSYHTTLGNSSYGAGYFDDGYGDYVSIIDQSTGAMIKWDVPDYWGGELGGYYGAGFFEDSSGNYVYLADGYNAVYAYANEYNTAGYFEDYSGNLVYLADNSYAGSFEDISGNYAYLADGSYGIYANIGYFDTLTYSSSDPEVLTFYPISEDRAIQLITTSTPDDRWGGISLYFDKDAKELRGIEHNSGDIFKISMEKVGNVTLQNKTKTKTHYKFDAFTGKIKQEKAPVLPYKIKKGIKFNRKTGKFYNKDKKEIPKEQAILS